MNNNKVTCTIYQTGSASYLFRGWEYAKEKFSINDYDNEYEIELDDELDVIILEKLFARVSLIKVMIDKAIYWLFLLSINQAIPFVCFKFITKCQSKGISLNCCISLMVKASCRIFSAASFFCLYTYSIFGYFF